MKTIVSIILIVCFTLTMSAEATYCYTESEKVPLYPNPTKAIVISSKKNTHMLFSAPMITPLREISCVDYDVTVIEKNNTTSLATIKQNMPAAIEGTTIYPCYRDDNGNDVIPTSYLYVELKDSSDFVKLLSVAKAKNCRIIQQNSFMPLWYTLSLVSDMGYDSVEIANFIMETNLFASASPAFELMPSISYDPSVLNQWGLYNSLYEDIDISASEAWNYATGRGITLAVIDSGIDLGHEDLADNIFWKSYDAGSGTSPSRLYDNSDLSHGTHCAGIIGAVRNNNIGLSGVAPDVSLMSISVDFSSPDIEAQLADGINWAWENGADILSCSWNANIGNPMIKQAIDNAITNGRNQLGCIVVASTGNGIKSGSPIKFPADYREEIIAVGNIRSSGILNTSSCIGDAILVCAPGTNILSTVVDNSYGEMTGTSMACPHVSGVVALMLNLNPELTSSKVKEILARSTKKVGHLSYTKSTKYGTWNKYYGYGLIDASKAVINTIEHSLYQ